MGESEGQAGAENTRGRLAGMGTESDRLGGGGSRGGGAQGGICGGERQEWKHGARQAERGTGRQGCGENRTVEGRQRPAEWRKADSERGGGRRGRGKSGRDQEEE